MMSLNTLFIMLMAIAFNLVSGEENQSGLSKDTGTIYSEDRDPFKEGYFEITIACFCLMIFFIACMFTVRICLGNKRGNDSRSFFLVA